MLYSIVDIETTGGNYKQGKIIEIAIFVFDGKKVIDNFCSLVNPGIEVPPYVSQLTGITNNMLKNAPSFSEIARRVIEITTNTVIVAHNVRFDYGYLREELRRCDKKFQRKRICTQNLSKRLFKGLNAYGLGKICEALSIPMGRQHRAVEDAKATTYLFDKILKSDTTNLVQAILNKEDREHWPQQLLVQKVQKLPENAGIYYFINKQNEIIYIGRSNDIQDRVYQHFSDFPASEWRKAMYKEVVDIKYELTGSELLAMILERYEIKKHNPIYNQKKRTGNKYQWGIIHYKNEEGFICFKITKIKHRSLALSYHRTEGAAKKLLSKKIKEFNLFPAFCIIDEKQRNNQLTLNSFKLPNYNEKALKAIESFDYKYNNFFVVLEGRFNEEKTVLLIKKNRFIGFGYFEKEMLEHPKELSELIEKQMPNFGVDLIIKSYIRNEHLVKIVPIL